MSKLLDAVREAVRTRHYSLRTEEAYLRWVREYILFCGKRHPQELGAKDVSAFVSHLAVERAPNATSASAFIQDVRVYLRRAHARVPQQLPERPRVVDVFEQVRGEAVPRPWRRSSCSLTRTFYNAVVVIVRCGVHQTAQSNHGMHTTRETTVVTYCRGPQRAGDA